MPRKTEENEPLENGLKVYSRQRPGTQAVRVRVTIETTLYVVPGTTLGTAGSRDDMDVVLANLSTSTAADLAVESAAYEPASDITIEINDD